jgi:hypothetical protein
MKCSLGLTRIPALVGFLAAALVTAAAADAQGTNPNLVPELEKKQETNQQLEQRALNQAPPKVDPQEEAAYKAFYDTNPQDADTRIKLGEAFVQKYPMSRYDESRLLCQARLEQLLCQRSKGPCLKSG